MSKKAWLDLACWFKNKVWVGGWGLQYYFVFFMFLHFPGKSGKKKKAFKLVSACFSSAFRERRSLCAGGTRRPRLGSCPFHTEPGWSGLIRRQREERPRGSKGQWLLEQWTYHLCSKIVLVLGPSLQVPRVDRLRRDHVSSERGGARETA